MKKAGIVCCSNGQKKEYKETISKLEKILAELGMESVFGNCIYEKEVGIYTGKERAAELMRCYRNEEIEHIFDISGGDIANGVLPYLNYDEIKKTSKIFWGYSDLTTIVNAIYTKTGKASVLYQIKNLAYDYGKERIEEFKSDKLINDFSYCFIQGTEMEGVVIGGNIRCFLKLAGTEYMPDFKEKVLLLESLGGTVPQMETYLSQLQQLGAFEKVAGILLGTFTQMEKEACVPTIQELFLNYIPETMPVAETGEIGHGTDAKAIWIGKDIKLKA